jgi:hypothetical protein
MPQLVKSGGLPTPLNKSGGLLDLNNLSKNNLKKDKLNYLSDSILKLLGILSIALLLFYGLSLYGF